MSKIADMTVRRIRSVESQRAVILSAEIDEHRNHANARHAAALLHVALVELAESLCAQGRPAALSAPVSDVTLTVGKLWVTISHFTDRSYVQLEFGGDPNMTADERRPEWRPTHVREHLESEIDKYIARALAHLVRD